MQGLNILSANQLIILTEHITNCYTQYSRQNMERALGWAQEVTGFESAIVSHISIQYQQPEIDNFINHSFNPQWLDTYFSQNYSTIDPVIAHAAKRNETFEWVQAYRTAGDRCPGSFFDAARDYGLHNGLACSASQKPGHEPNTFTICSVANINKKQLELTACILNILTPAFHEIMVSFQPLPSEQQVFLTGKELEVLGWAKQGKSVWDISTILRISESTVKFHLQNSYRKLDAGNRAHAIAKAIQLGLI